MHKSAGAIRQSSQFYEHVIWENFLRAALSAKEQKVARGSEWFASKSLVCRYFRSWYFSGHGSETERPDENVRNSPWCAYRECCAPGIARPWINPCIFNLVQLHDEVRSPPRRHRTVAGAAEQRRSLKKRIRVQTIDNLICISRKEPCS